MSEFNVSREAARATAEADASMKKTLFEGLPEPPESVQVTVELMKELKSMDTANPVLANKELAAYVLGLSVEQRARLKSKAENPEFDSISTTK